MFTGMQNEYHLLTANSVLDDGHPEAWHLEALETSVSNGSLPAGYELSLPREETYLEETYDTYAHRTHPHTHELGGPCLACERMRKDSEYETTGALESYTAASMNFDHEGDADLQKHILAQEVVKLRAEVARLEHQKVNEMADDGTLAALRDEILMLQARKAETIETRETDKRLLKIEIQKLLQEAALASDREHTKRISWKDRVEQAFDVHGNDNRFDVHANDYRDLEMMVEHAAVEHQLVVAVRAMRHQLRSV